MSESPFGPGVHQLRSTGEEHYFEPGEVHRVPPFAGEHLWMAPVAFRVDPDDIIAGRTIRMDPSTLIHAGGFVCYHCEEMFDRRLIHRRCPGAPK